MSAKSVSDASATSPPIDMVLPQRRFVNPLAKSLVELRRDLVLDPDRNTSRVGQASAPHQRLDVESSLRSQSSAE